MTTYVLHYAPDNASLIIRLVLEELGVPYTTRLVDRSSHAQRSDKYKALNPVGRIPALETPVGPLFETAAIALWLVDQHPGTTLAPTVSDPARGAFLSWLFFLSNTVHAEQRSLFYPSTIVGPDASHQAALQEKTCENLTRHYALIEKECANGLVLGSDEPTICDFYTAALMRWSAIYPPNVDRSWFDLTAYPSLLAMTKRLETRASTAALVSAEGLGATPFSSPQPPNPPEGSAL